LVRRPTVLTIAAERSSRLPRVCSRSPSSSFNVFTCKATYTVTLSHLPSEVVLVAPRSHPYATRSFTFRRTVTSAFDRLLPKFAPCSPAAILLLILVILLLYHCSIIIITASGDATCLMRYNMRDALWVMHESLMGDG